MAHFLESTPDPEKTRRWWVKWLHNTETSSWWADEIIEATTAEEAAGKILGRVDFEKHTSYRDRRMKVRVRGPIPDEHQEFSVAPSAAVDVVALEDFHG